MGLELKNYKIGIVLLIFMSILLSGCISGSTTSDNIISEGTSIEEIDKGADIDEESTIDEVGTENKGEEIDEGIYNDTIETNGTEDLIVTDETNGTIEEETIANEIIEGNEAEEIINETHIESVEGYAISPAKLKIKLLVYNNESITIKSEGTLEAILYEKIEDSDEGPIIGDELDRWTSQIKESDYGQNNELVKELEFHNKNVTSSSGFGYMDYTFTTIDGKIFKTSDEYINLVLE